MIKIKGVKINRKEIDKQVANSRKFRQAAHDLVNKKVQREKALMIEEFNNHPVTTELKGGAGASNLSGSLGGYGNLFSFMGFPEGSTPTKEVLEFLKLSVTIKKQKSSGLTADFTINIPTINDFDNFRMPWEGGNSWVKSIERGMSSFSYFMHKAYNASRSGAGMQIDNKLRGKSSSAVQYMSVILNNFKKRLIKSK